MKRLFGGLVALGLFLGAAGQARSDWMYWTDFGSGDIRRANLDGTGQETLITGQRSPAVLKLDLAAGQMYWTNYGGDIRRANVDGTGETILVSQLSAPSGLALDVPSGKMYWTDFGSTAASHVIGQANLDGSSQVTLLQNLSAPHGMALDAAAGKMYWTDRDSGDVRRANLDGSGQETLVRGLGSPHGIALDVPGGKVYWTDWSPGDIRRANLDGSGQEILVRSLSAPADITLDLAGGQMYWADFGLGTIVRADLDGSTQVTLVRGLSNPVGIALALSSPAPAPVLVTGYSADVISDRDPSARFAQPFHAGTFAWFEAGAVDDDGTQHDGLPAGLTFISATGSGATYQLQPANASNVLQLGADQTGTLTLTTPAAYSTLYVLASSGDGTPSSVGSGTIAFADGSSQAFSFNCFDWCNGPGGLHPEAVLPAPNGRADVGPNGTAFVYNQDCDFQLYETVIALDPSHTGVAITSIDFTGASDAFSSSIFAVSGQ